MANVGVDELRTVSYITDTIQYSMHTFDQFLLAKRRLPEIGGLLDDLHAREFLK